MVPRPSEPAACSVPRTVDADPSVGGLMFTSSWIRASSQQLKTVARPPVERHRALFFLPVG